MRRRKPMRSTMRMRRRVRKRASSPEVKYKDIAVYNYGVSSAWSATASADLVNTGASKLIRNNVLSSITQGTGADNRIGARIFVKSIVMYTTFYICPSTDQNYLYNSVLTRWTCGSWIVDPATTNITAYFGAATHAKMSVPLNRRAYTVHMDRRISYNTGAGINRYADASGVPQLESRGGLVKFVKFRLPVNRVVTFKQDGNVKEDYNVYTFVTFGNLPTLQDNTSQLLCGDFFIRMYYTDV